MKFNELKRQIKAKAFICWVTANLSVVYFSLGIHRVIDGIERHIALGKIEILVFIGVGAVILALAFISASALERAEKKFEEEIKKLYQ